MLVYHEFRGDIASQIGTHAREKSKQPGCARSQVHPAAALKCGLGLRRVQEAVCVEISLDVALIREPIFFITTRGSLAQRGSLFILVSLYDRCVLLLSAKKKGFKRTRSGPGTLQEVRTSCVIASLVLEAGALVDRHIAAGVEAGTAAFRALGSVRRCARRADGRPASQK